MRPKPSGFSGVICGDANCGFRVLRFWNGDVLRQTDSIVETIYEALHRPEMDGRFD
jgi:very-short-patch-repair endonuclease